MSPDTRLLEEIKLLAIHQRAFHTPPAPTWGNPLWDERTLRLFLEAFQLGPYLPDSAPTTRAEVSRQPPGGGPA